jgi:hypothetical protein
MLRGRENIITWVYRSNIMQKLIVSNFVTIDGYYEAKDKTIDGLFAN